MKSDTLGVLPEVLLLLVSGSTPRRLIFGQWEYSRKSGIVLPGVLPKKLFLYTGSDLDMMYNLDILLPLDTLGVLPVLLFLVSGSTPGRLICCQWEYSRKSGIVLPGVLPKKLFL